VHENQSEYRPHAQLVNITELVQAALSDANGALPSFLLPHTTRGLTSTSLRPARRGGPRERLQRRRRRLGLGSNRDPDGPNAPSPLRASLMNSHDPHPAGGRQALSRPVRGIFFCAFDGPRDRKVLGPPVIARPTSQHDAGGVGLASMARR